MTSSCTSSGSSWYVDPATTGSGNGSSWTNAWTTLDAINWRGVRPGDTIYLSGGSTSQAYPAPTMTIGASDTSGAPITIEPGVDAGHNGTVTFDYSSCGSTCGTQASS